MIGIHGARLHMKYNVKSNTYKQNRKHSFTNSSSNIYWILIMYQALYLRPRKLEKE